MLAESAAAALTGLKRRRGGPGPRRFSAPVRPCVESLRHNDPR